MNIFVWIIVMAWLAFFAYWSVAAFRVKKDMPTSARGIWWDGGGIWRFIATMIVLYLVIFQPGAVHGIFDHPGGPMPGLFLGILGDCFGVVGIALAFWARWHLGRNWSPHPTLKVGHELVTSGPYRVIRHPIYTGILLAVLGSAIVSGAFWFLVFLLLVIVFVNRVRVEEVIMMRQFPDQYPAYRARTKALIPFIW